MSLFITLEEKKVTPKDQHELSKGKGKGKERKGKEKRIKKKEKF